MKKFKKVCIAICLVFLSLFTISCEEDCSGIFPDDSEPLDVSTFDDFSRQMFELILGKDELTMNYLFEHPENFNLGHYEPTLPTPGVTNVIGVTIINYIIGTVKRYDYNALNDDQKMTYNLLVDLIEKINAKTPEMSYLSNNYLGSYLGYQAQLPLLLVEYHFRSRLDVENYFKFLELVPETFNEYVDFEFTKAEKNYGMPDFVIDKVIAQCESFISSVEAKEHFMITTVNQKIDDCEFLTDEEKETFKEKNIEMVNGPLLEGYRIIIQRLPELKGKATNNMGLAYYYDANGNPIGKTYYELDFQDTVGYKITIPEAEAYIDGLLAYYEEKLPYYQELAKNNEQFRNEVLNYQLMDNTPEEQLAYYQEAITAYFPPLTTKPKVTVKYIDKAMEEHFSPAAYMVSAIDNFTEEFIYLNNADIYDQDGKLDYNYLYTTLAHEGFAGHLYQNVYFKSQDVNPLRKVLKSSGYSEGWATYTEIFSLELLRGQYSDDFIDYLIFNEEYTAAMYSRLDMGIHYDGWTLEEAATHIRKYAPNASDEAIQATYEQLIEVPNNMQTYFFTYFKIRDLRNEMMDIAQDSFDYITFHKYILDCGPAPLRFVEDYVRQKYE